MRKKTGKTVAGAIALLMCIIISFGGCGNVAANGSGEVEEKENRRPEINAWGEVTAHDVHQLTIDFPTAVESVSVEEGDVVHQGDVLAVLDLSEFSLTIAKTQEQKAAGEAVISGLQQSTTGLKAQIQQQKQNVETAQKDFQNSKTLYEAGGISQKEYELQEERLNTQKTTLRVLETELGQTDSGSIGQQSRSNQVIDKELDIFASKKNKAYLAENRIVSPVANGVVKSVGVEPGMIISGQPAKVIIELIDTDTQYIRAEVDEEFIDFLQMDTPVRVVPVRNPELELKGYVTKIGALAEEKDGGRIVNVQIRVEDAEQILSYGYTVDVYFAKE